MRKRSMKQEDGINSTDRGRRGTQKRKRNKRDIIFTFRLCQLQCLCCWFKAVFLDRAMWSEALAGLESLQYVYTTVAYKKHITHHFIGAGLFI